MEFYTSKKGVSMHRLVPQMMSKETRLVICTHYSRYSHVHIRLAGSGLHIPLDAHVAVILADGANIELHLKKISAPSVVF